MERRNYIYTYDDNGNLIKETCYYGGNDGGHTGYTYDDKGNLTEIVFYYNGAVTSRVVLEYTSIFVSRDRAEEIREAQREIVFAE